MASRESCAEEKAFTNEQGRIFLQEGCGNELQLLECHGADSVDRQNGASTPFFCYNHRTGQLEIEGSTPGQPGAITTTLTFRARKTIQALQMLRCDFNLYYLFGECPPSRLGDSSVFDWGYRLDRARITGLTHNNPVIFDTPNPSTFAAAVSAETQELFSNIMLTEQTLTGTPVLYAVDFVGDESCGDDICNSFTETCEFGAAVGDGGEVFTTNNGSTWVRTAADPGGGGLTLRSVIVVDLGSGVTRIIVREFDDTNGDSLWYSDDNGANWTEIAQPWGGTTTAGNFRFNNEVHQDFDGNLWWYVGETTGQVFKSEDNGLTWIEKFDGTGYPNVAPISGGIMTGNAGILIAGGNDDFFIVSLDGGESWTIRPVDGTTDTILSAAVTCDKVIWVSKGGTGARLYRSIDNGVTFTEVNFAGTGVIGSISGIGFSDDCCGFFQFSGIGFNTVFRTIDGGNQWHRHDEDIVGSPTSIKVCDCNTAYVTTLDGTIAKVSAV